MKKIALLLVVGVLIFFSSDLAFAHKVDPKILKGTNLHGGCYYSLAADSVHLGKKLDPFKKASELLIHTNIAYDSIYYRAATDWFNLFDLKVTIPNEEINPDEEIETWHPIRHFHDATDMRSAFRWFRGVLVFQWPEPAFLAVSQPKHKLRYTSKTVLW